MCWLLVFFSATTQDVLVGNNGGEGADGWRRWQDSVFYRSQPLEWALLTSAAAKPPQAGQLHPPFPVETHYCYTLIGTP